MMDVGLLDGFWFKLGSMLGEVAWVLAILFVIFLYAALVELKTYWKNRGQKG